MTNTAAYAGIAMCTLVMLGGGGAAVATRQKMAGGGAAFIGLVSVIMLSLYVAGYLGGAPKRDRAIKEATAEGGEFKEWMVSVYDDINSNEAYDYKPKGDEREKAIQFMEMGKLFEIAQCKYSDWSSWDNDCSDASNRRRKRTRTIGADADAVKCVDLNETELCGAKDCMMSEWSECADGKRNRTVVSPAMFGGKVCGVMEEVGPCAIATTPVASTTPTIPMDASSTVETIRQVDDVVTEQAKSAAATVSTAVMPVSGGGSTAAVQPTAEAVTTYIMEKGLDLTGATIKMLEDTSVVACKQECDNESECALFVRNPTNGTCWLKKGEGFSEARVMPTTRNAHIKSSKLENVKNFVGDYAKYAKGGHCAGTPLFESAAEALTSNDPVAEAKGICDAYTETVDGVVKKCKYVSVWTDNGYRVYPDGECNDTVNRLDIKTFQRVKLE